MFNTLAYTTVSAPKILSVQLNKASYFVDEDIEGIIQLDVKSQAILSDITISVFIIENWIEKISNEADKGDLLNQCLLSFNLNLPKLLNINSPLISFPTGIHRFPFKFKLPPNSQPSFEYPNDNKTAFVRYCLDVKILSPQLPGQTSNYLLIKARPKIEIDKHLQYESTINVHKWGLVKKGTTTLKVSLTKEYFTSEEKVNLTIIIDNSKGKMVTHHCKIVIMRNITVKSKRDYKVISKFEDQFGAQVLPTVVEDGKKNSFQTSIGLRQEDLKNFQYKNEKRPFEKVDFNYLMPSCSARIVECTYQIKISLYFNGFVIYKERPRIYVPIFIVHQSVEDYGNYINNKNMGFNNNNIINTGIQNNNINLEQSNELPSQEMLENNNISNNYNNNKNVYNINDLGDSNGNYINDESAPCVDMGAPGFANFGLNNNMNANYNNPQSNEINNMGNQPFIPKPE